MRKTIIGLLSALVLAAAAAPAWAGSPLPPGTHPVVPSGNSGADQYVESVPTSGGNQSTGSLPIGGSTQPPAGPTSTVVPKQSRTVLAHHGKAGLNVLAFAAATAPARGRHDLGVKGVPTGSAAPAKQNLQPGASSSPASAILGSLTGLGSLGSAPLLLLLLIAAALGGVAGAFWRKRVH